MEKELLEHLSGISKKEMVNHPSHYQFGDDKTYEVIKIIEVYGFDFHLGNCFKYISRAGKKILKKKSRI